MASAGLLALTALAIGQSPAQAQGTALDDLRDVGTAAVWGPDVDTGIPQQQPSPEQAHTAFTQLAAIGPNTLGLTAAGKVELLGNLLLPGLEPDPRLDGTTVVDLAGSSGGFAALAVTAAGDVVGWGAASPEGIAKVPGDLHDATDADISTNGSFAAAVKRDGSVVAWGGGDDVGQFDPPLLDDAVAVSVGSNYGYVLRRNGTVVPWGRNVDGETTLPALLTDDTDGVRVEAVDAGGSYGLALLSDGRVLSWGADTGDGQPNAVPAGLPPIAAIATTGAGYTNVAIDTDGHAHFWGFPADLPTETTTVPTTADGRITAVEFGYSNAMLAIIRQVLEVTKPVITGTAEVGETLHATPATFSGTPDDVTGQWFADGIAIDDAADEDYTLTTDELDKAITYRSTATTTDGPDVTSDSASTAKVGAAGTVASTTTIAAARSTYGARATVTVTVANGTAGNVRLSGAGAALTQPVRSGKATFALPATLRPGTYRLTAAYTGTTGVTASTGTGTLAIAKARPGVVKVKVAKANKLTRKKKAKATITVATPAGLAKASGKVTITVKKGKQTKHVTRVIRNGKVTTKLPKMTKKGKWKVTVTYTGDAYYLPASSRAIKVKVKK